MRQPRFTVLTPVFQTPRNYLLACVDSVRAQDFRNWELVLVDDGNSRELASLLDQIADDDPRIQVVHLPGNVGIAAASQKGLDAALGDFLVLLDHDDLLSPRALQRVADVLAADAHVDYVYSDEDKVNDDGVFVDPFFKPDWSPERFRHHMYTCHLSALRTSLVREVGGFRTGFDGSQDYDLVLRVTERAAGIHHLPEVLYHWRIHPGSTSAVFDQKPGSFDAARRAVAEHCARSGINADVTEAVAGSVRVRRHLDSRPLVSLIVPTFGKVADVWGRREVLLDHFLKSVERLTSYENFEYVIVGDRRLDEARVHELVTSSRHPITYVDYEQPAGGFNFSEKVNIGAARARGEYLIILNDDLEVITPDWIEELLGHAQVADVGAVGGMYYFEDDTVQHAGVSTVLGAQHLFYKWPRRQQPFGHHLAVAREVSVVTGACLMVSKADFVRVGGFTEVLPNNFNDVDFCLKLRSDGRRNVWTPYAELYHFESKSRVNKVHAFEQAILHRRWATWLTSDPCYNPNLVALPPNWLPHDDWDLYSRDWPTLVREVAGVSNAGYLEVNPDVVVASGEDPSFDVAGHIRHVARGEGRLHVPMSARAAVDQNRRRRAPATPNNFTTEGYLAANPDLAAVAARDPDWDAQQHFIEYGVKEGRYCFVGGL